jgi:alpha-mannosidase
MNRRGAWKLWIVAPLVLAASAARGQETLWSIGRPDGRFSDLAFDPDLRMYDVAFGRGLTYTVGRSDAKKDFSAIQPGPLDEIGEWREQAFVIRFDFPGAPSDLCALRISLVDTHNKRPPTLQVRVNDRSIDMLLAPGRGEFSLLRPEKGDHRTLSFLVRGEELKAHGNEIELRTVAGSWLLYDAVSFVRLSEEEARDVRVDAQDTVFFVERGGELLQEVTVDVSGMAGVEPVTCEVSSGGTVVGRAELAAPVLGISRGAVYVEPADAPRELTVRVAAGGYDGETTRRQKPCKRWRIYVAPTVHVDIGYTDLQRRVIALTNRNTDVAMALADDFPGYFFNLEVSWAAQQWLEDRRPGLHEALFEEARNGRLGIGASYLNVLTGLCSFEEMARNLYYAARLHRDHNVPFDYVMLTDAPSHVWATPSVLASAGIRYLSVGVNVTRAPLFRLNLHHKNPFWWEGPDGGRVLTWFAQGYGMRQVRRVGIRATPERMRTAIASELAWWRRRDDYPYDAIYFHGSYGDNLPIRRTLAANVAAYNAKYAYPRLILCSPDTFFQYIEGTFADAIPTLRGGGGSWWEDGAGSSAVETAMTRGAHDDVVAAEKVWTAATIQRDGAAYPKAAFDRAWSDILLFDEHTWGASASVRDPTADMTQRQWAYKAAFAENAKEGTRRLLRTGLQALVERLDAPDGSLVVFNPSGRVRSGVVHVRVPRGQMVFDGDALVPQQVVDEPADASEPVLIAFQANDVPAAGYRTFRAAASAMRVPAPPVRVRGSVLENDFYRVMVDPATGAVASLFDKRRGVELVDLDSRWQFGHVTYGEGGALTRGKNDELTPDPSKIRWHLPVCRGGVTEAARGWVYSTIRSIATLRRFPKVQMEITLYEQEPRIDFTYRLDKELTFDKEALYIAFPFAGADPRFRYEVGGGNVRPNEDHLPGACLDWFAVQRWVTVNTDRGGVAWTPVDTPLISLCRPNAGKWLLGELPVTNGTVLAYAMNNYWFTNYKAGQDGSFTFRYSLTADEAMPPEQASQFGESVVSPLRALRLYPGRAAPDLPPRLSFCRVEPETVELTALKPGDDGHGWVVRLRETAGRATTARVVSDYATPGEAWLCDLVERGQRRLDITESGAVPVELPANGYATIWLR